MGLEKGETKEVGVLAKAEVTTRPQDTGIQRRVHPGVSKPAVVRPPVFAQICAELQNTQDRDIL